MKRLLALLIAIWLSIGIAFAGNQTTSSTLASTMITNARYYLNDPTVHGGTQMNIWSDAEMLMYLNQGTMDIVAKSHCLEDVETETLIQGRADYALSDPFIVIKYVIYACGKSLEKGDMKGFSESFGRGTQGDSDDEGEPAYWTSYENDVIVYPLPDATAAGNAIDVYVVDRPTTVTSSENVLVPAQYDKALVYYIVAQGWAKDNRMDLFGTYMTLYQQEIDRYRADHSTQEADKGE